ncbi:MAG: sigma-70 family RNA polymerase sigma factor [Muribaculaceae bacterium]|nr:sigma-70 family RNA polymerase sigma factor [Muribaculaceae bacterium]
MMTIDAFEQQAPRLRQLALQAAAAAGADQDTAEDIAQETMLRLWQMRDDPRLYNPEAYASTIARHQVLNHQRHKPPLPLDERQVTSLTSPSPLDIIEQREDERWLQERIRNLPPTQHAILHMRQVEHRTSNEIAAIMGIQPSSVCTLLARARRQLLEEIRQQSNRN